MPWDGKERKERYKKSGKSTLKKEKKGVNNEDIEVEPSTCFGLFQIKSSVMSCAWALTYHLMLNTSFKNDGSVVFRKDSYVVEVLYVLWS